MSRKPNPNTPTTCAAPDCNQPREWNNQRQCFNSRYCAKHAKERRLAKQAAVTSGRYTPAEVLAAWDAHPLGAEFTYQGQHVYGLAEMQEGTFLMVLAGVNDPLVIGAGETLRRVEKP